MGGEPPLNMHTHVIKLILSDHVLVTCRVLGIMILRSPLDQCSYMDKYMYVTSTELETAA